MSAFIETFTEKTIEMYPILLSHFYEIHVTLFVTNILILGLRNYDVDLYFVICMTYVIHFEMVYELLTLFIHKIY